MDNLLRPVVNDLGYALWHVETGSSGDGAWLRVYIDAPSGIGVEDCETVSRELSATLAVADLAYDLEVSSPGIERPLASIAHFAQFVGERARVRLYAPVDGQRRLSGVIAAAQAGVVELTTAEATHALALDNIAKAWLKPASVFGES